MKKLLIVDLSNVLYKAYFGIQFPMKTPDKVLVNAVYGTANAILTHYQNLRPDFVVICADSRSNDRKTEFKDYKANRKSMPPDLRHQVPMIKDLLLKMGMTVLEESGFEADDLIADIVLQNSDKECYILSSDKDLLQLVNERVWALHGEKVVGINEVFEKFEIYPDKILDYLALIGDSSDNIPGVKGIGPKKAVELINEFGSLQNILENVDKVKGAASKKLMEGKESALMSQDLARLRSTSIDFKIEETKLDIKATELLTHWNMKKLKEKFMGLVIS